MIIVVDVMVIILIVIIITIIHKLWIWNLKYLNQPQNKPNYYLTLGKNNTTPAFNKNVTSLTTNNNQIQNYLNDSTNNNDDNQRDNNANRVFYIQ